MDDPAVRERDLPWPSDRVDPARWLLGATSSGEPHSRAVVANWKEIGRLRSQVAAVRALAEKWADAPADTRVASAAVLAALDEVAW